VEVVIRPVRAGEEEQLRAVARAAKAHWGYDAGQVSVWAASLDYRGDVHVAELNGSPAGYATLVTDGPIALLDELWVGPEWMGKGIGSRLFRFVAARAVALGAERLEWEADPHAVGFYERMGGRFLRDSEPSEWGRILPVMGVDL
jgi:GNAT superfamily N-acetyltransferase